MFCQHKICKLLIPKALLMLKDGNSIWETNCKNGFHHEEEFNFSVVDDIGLWREHLLLWSFLGSSKSWGLSTTENIMVFLYGPTLCVDGKCRTILIHDNQTVVSQICSLRVVLLSRVIDAQVKYLNMNTFKYDPIKFIFFFSNMSQWLPMKIIHLYQRHTWYSGTFLSLFMQDNFGCWETSVKIGVTLQTYV